MTCRYFGKDCPNTSCNPGATVVEIVPLTPAEDAELRAEPTVGELGLCSPVGTPGACPPKCCEGVPMTREEAIEDSRFTFSKPGPVPDEPMVKLNVEITEPGWAPKLAELLGGHMSILLEAEKIVNGHRRDAYGTPERNFERIALLWNAYLLGKPNGPLPITPQDTAHLMILLKVARLIESPDHRDSMIDVAGYAACIETMWQG